jgi:predicted glycosyltransferase
MKPSLLFYCQHSVGLGHLMRSYALCAGLSERFRVVLLAGGDLPEGIDPPPGIELVALPPLGVQKNGFGSRNGDLDRTWELRHRRILMTLGRVQPQVVLVELFPFGRAKFARELVPLLEEARAMGAFTACSLRDILVSGDTERDDRARRLADELLDAVLVHSDPRFARLEETFKPSTPLATPVHYTGFVTGPNGFNGHARGEHIVVSAGGGRVGFDLLREAMETSRGRPMKAIAGPLMPDEDYARLQELRPDDVELVRSVPNLAHELSLAAGSISQCGYNTALDLLRTRVPALVVPYATEEEDEQTRRAERLQRLGVVKVSDRADPRLLDFTPEPAELDLDGAHATTELLAR